MEEHTDLEWEDQDGRDTIVTNEAIKELNFGEEDINKEFEHFMTMNFCHSFSYKKLKTFLKNNDFYAHLMCYSLLQHFYPCTVNQ